MKRELWSDAGWQWKGSRTQPQNIDGFTEPQQPRLAFLRSKRKRMQNDKVGAYRRRQNENMPLGNRMEQHILGEMFMRLDERM